jgi:hypothetical protein
MGRIAGLLEVGGSPLQGCLERCEGDKNPQPPLAQLKTLADFLTSATLLLEKR